MIQPVGIGRLIVVVRSANKRLSPGTNKTSVRGANNNYGDYEPLLGILLPLILLVVAADVALPANPIPLPEFTEYQVPRTPVPEANPAWREYLDLAALAVGLSLASYLALRRRSRRGLFLLTIASLAWLGFWRQGCTCPIGAIQNVTLAVCDPGYAVPAATVAFFVLPLVFALFFGRTFCAAVCPLGAVQELVALRPVRLPGWLEHTLGLLAYVYLGLAVVYAATGTAFVICRYDPFVAFFRLGGDLNMLILGGCFLVAGIFIGRPYCRFLCPYGVLLRWASKVSKWHVRIPPDECIKCRLCEDVCPYGAIRQPTVVQDAGQRAEGRRRLAALIVLLPVLVAGGAWLGSGLSVPLAKLHPTVRLAEQMRLEETGRAEGSTDASDAFRATGRPLGDLYRDAIKLQTGRFVAAGRWLGGWVGLVIALKLIHLCLRRRRDDYQPDRGTCVSCGRCFWYCPNQQALNNGGVKI